MRDALSWYVVVQVLGLAAWPLVARACAPLDDRGWGLSKIVGTLGVGWLVWLVCMVAPVPFTRGTLALAVLGVAALAWGPPLRRDEFAVLGGWLRARRWLVLVWELIFLGGFVLFALLRSHAPAITSTEKPMDMAFLNGFLAASSLPTQDTWLAGYGVPYYYFGYFLLASLGKLSDVPAGVAYNLAAATVPALALTALAALAWNLARAAAVCARWAAVGAACATVLGLLCGNLAAFFEFLVARGLLSRAAGEPLGIKRFAENIVPAVWPPNNGYWWFSSSRIIPNLQPDGINEFPFFSALLADLHPHFVAVPFEILVIALGACHVLSRGATLRSWWTQGLAALALGGLLVINTWDIAAFWLLYVALGLFAATLGTWRRGWLAALAALPAGVALFLPYFVGYRGPPLGIGFVLDDRTPLGSLLVIFGWALALLSALGLFVRWRVADRRGWWLAGAGAVIGLGLLVIGQPALGVLLALVLVLLPWPGVLTRLDPAIAATLGIGALAAAMLLGVELVFLDDVFHSRMNTVFKFHLNAWLLAAVASGVGVALIGQFTRRARWLVCGVAAACILAGLVYPVSAVVTRLGERPGEGVTLDGAAFLSADDRAAIRWLAEQAGPRGRAVIAEAVGDEYSLAGRMSTFSGAAAVLGWAGHELQWRGPLPELGARQGDLAAIYRDAPRDAVRGLLDRYGVRFVVVGDQERRSYGDGVNSRFDGILQPAARFGGTVIYRVT